MYKKYIFLKRARKIPAAAGIGAQTAVSKIFEYIAERNPSGAQKWIDAATSAVAKLETMPERGGLIEKHPGVRQIYFRSGSGGDLYRMIYLVKKERNAVYILTVRHGAELYK